MLQEPYDAWEKLAEQGRYADAMESYIRTYDHVTLVELQRRLGAYMETKGDICICLPTDPNIVHWVGMSQQFADTVISLLAEKRIDPTPTSAMVYMIDGGMAKLPVVKRIGKTPRKKVGWLPIVLRPRSVLAAPGPAAQGATS